jgi:hypothetical protein
VAEVKPKSIQLAEFEVSLYLLGESCFTASSKISLEIHDIYGRLHGKESLE